MDTDIDEIVETSDFEEKEEIEASKSPYWQYRNQDIYRRDDNYSPRKRVKVKYSHVEKPPCEILRDSSVLNTPSRPATSPTCDSSAASSEPSFLFPTPTRFLDHISNLDDEYETRSQDPLLLGGKGLQYLDEPQSGCITHQTRSVSPPLVFPSSPSPNVSVRSRSHDPLSLFSSPPRVRDQPVYVADSGSAQTNDELTYSCAHVATPSSPLSLPPTSPRQPILAQDCGERQFPPTPPDHQALSTAAESSELRNSGAGDEEYIHQGGRYPLRQRQAHQMQPYRHERLVYQKALREIPDAIVSARSLQYQRDQPDEYQEESQEAGQRSDEQDESQNTQHPSQAPEGDAPPPHLEGMLEDLPATDEEEDKQMRTVSKEARKMLRIRRAKEIEAAKQARQKEKESATTRQKIERFPLSKTYLSVDQSPRKARRTPTGPDPTSIYQRDTVSPPSPTRATSSVRSSPSSFEEPRSNILTNTRETAIPISNHDDNGSIIQTPNSTRASSPHRIEDSSTSSGGSSPAGLLTRKRRQILNRLYPASMVVKLVDGTALQPKVRPQSATVVSNSNEDKGRDIPLLSGQTRVRRGNPRHKMDIRGDSESEDDVCNDGVVPIEASGCNRSQSAHLGFRSQRIQPDIVEISSSSSESDLDDSDIQAYFDDNQHSERGSNRHGREESLIDWMLTRTRTVNGNRPRAGEKGKRTSGGGPKSRYKIDIATNGGRGYGTERQTLLNFKGRKRKRNGSTIQRDHAIRPPEGREWNTGSSAVAPEDSTTDTLLISDSKKSRKVKGRERKKRAQAHELYTFASNGVHLSSGRREAAMITVDIEDESFHRALAPLSQDWAPSKPPGNRRPTSRPGRAWSAPRQDDTLDEPSATPAETNQSKRQKHIPGDFDIPILHSGYSFSARTYIGRGWLHELISIISSSADPILPIVPATVRFGFFPGMNISAFSDSLEKICDDLLEFATGIPEDDNAGLYEEWHIHMRIVCQLASWLPIGASEGDCAIIRNSIRMNITKLVKCFRDLALVKASLDMSTFMVCWFAVELSARLKDQPPWSGSARDCCLKNSVDLLVQYLLVYGLQDSTLPIRDHEELNSLNLPQYTSELWVRLFHLLDNLPKANTRGRKELHTFWQVVKTEIQKDGASSLSNLEASETIWRTIFSLSALSQFSVHGMVTSTVRLPACWELVVLALKRIRLTVDPITEHTLTESSLNKRDEYIGLITARCFHLWDRWKWHLDDASVMFNQLVEIYQSRKFANLRHEPADFPGFILHNNWDLLSKYESTDTAFVLFLKLIVQAAHGHATEDALSKPDLSAKVKKLLSLAIPVGSLPFTKSHPPTVHDLSMLYNRLSAVVIGIYLSPAQHASRILHARTYIDFRSADDTTRIAFIRGMMNIAVIMVSQQLPLDGINEWCVDMANVLFEEYKKTPMEGATENRQDPTIIARDRLRFSMQVFIGSIRRIVQAHKQIPEYPDPNLLSSLTPIIRTLQRNQVPKMTFEIRRLLESVLEIRILVMPAPSRPRIAPAAADTNQDSQDDFGTFDIDMSDPELIAALGEVDPPEMQNRKAKDAILSKFVESTSLFWIFWRAFSASTQDLDVTNRIQCQNYEAWLGCWLSCADILIRTGNTMSWTEPINLWEDLLKQVVNEPLRRWIDLACWLKVLTLDPLTYMTFTTHYVGLFFEVLALTEEAKASAYLSMILSINRGSHPLFNNVLPDNFSGAPDDDISADEFPALRRSLIRGIFSNLNQLIRDEVHGGPSPAQTNEVNEGYIGLCIKIFSTMKGTCLV
ncbi:Mus7/MMS22 family-domain-containing protein [Infundibulicybe gibba]|nr:Mus7/MMS22 family-domain-containing protein [Infundibulicybe gibba]